ncbi:hypothetical protein FKW77_003216 [Venturia effusa]|uniref:Uncharacterized protein n=1 Tax=Venturia effusa TaxID=50376 RepID=A0A517LDH7_9PEZI|nr:hypothetical protein FKW77_003216 [Venturia effusa]
MHLPTTIFVALAGFSLTSALAIPNVDVDMNSFSDPKNSKSSDPKNSKSQGFNPSNGQTKGKVPGSTLNSDLHHVETKNLCGPIKDKSKKADCTRELERCMPEYKNVGKEDRCEHKVLQKYNGHM